VFICWPLGIVTKFWSVVVEEVLVVYEDASLKTKKNGYVGEPTWALRGVLGYRLSGLLFPLGGGVLVGQA